MKDPTDENLSKGAPASYARTALDTLDFLWDKLFDAERGLCHYFDTAPHLPGMLSDQAYTLRAFVDAAQYTGETRYLDSARELADWTLEHLRSTDGSFYDTPHNPKARGGLKRRDRSILENAVLAEALLRLSQMTWVPDYADTAREMDELDPYETDEAWAAATAKYLD